MSRETLNRVRGSPTPGSRIRLEQTSVSVPVPRSTVNSSRLQTTWPVGSRVAAACTCVDPFSRSGRAERRRPNYSNGTKPGCCSSTSTGFSQNHGHIVIRIHRAPQVSADDPRIDGLGGEHDRVTPLGGEVPYSLVPFVVVRGVCSGHPVQPGCEGGESPTHSPRALSPLH